MLKSFVFIDIWFVKQDIQKWLKTKICSFYGVFENEQKKVQKFLTSGAGIWTPVIFPLFEFSREVRSPSSNQDKQR